MAKRTKKMSEEESDLKKELIGKFKKKDSSYSIPFKHKGLQKITNGVASGYFAEIMGMTQSGKSFLLYELMSECEKMKGYNLIFDLERALEDSYWKSVGITRERTEVEYENRVEKLFLIATNFILNKRKENKKCPIIIGIDSWPFIKTSEVQDAASAGKDRKIKGFDSMRHNNIIYQNLEPFLQIIDDNDAVLVLLNQLRVNHQIMFGDKTTSKGNEVLQYHTHLRLIGKIKGKNFNIVKSLGGDKKIQIGTNTEWLTLKNRGVKPKQSVVTKLIYAKGINPYSGIEELLVNDETVVAELKVKKDKKKQAEKVVSSLTKTKEVDPSTFKFKMKNDESGEWFDDIKSLIAAHPESLDPLITGKYSVSDEVIEESVPDIDDEEGSDEE